VCHERQALSFRQNSNSQGLRNTSKRSIANYSARRPYRVVTQANGEKHFKILTAPPLEIAVLAGEMIYQIRLGERLCISA